MEEVADANGELSKNDFILHVKVAVISLFLNLSLTLEPFTFNSFLSEFQHVQSV